MNEMAKAIDTNGVISDSVPKTKNFTVPKEKIREIIGPGGAMIREICDATGAKIDISDKGDVSIFAIGQENLLAAENKIKLIAIDPKVGEIFEGLVVKIIDSGVFVRFYGNKDGFVHISEIHEKRIEKISDHIEIGQKVTVKLIGFDRGKAKLTIKNASNDNINNDSESNGKNRSKTFEKRKKFF